MSVEGSARYPSEVETAVYFCCSEALQNVVRHASASAARIRVQLRADGLTFSIKDDGRGFAAPPADGRSGLQSMRDRVDVVGGTLDIVSKPGAGTLIRGWIPAAVQETPQSVEAQEEPDAGQATQGAEPGTYPFSA